MNSEIMAFASGSEVRRAGPQIEGEILAGLLGDVGECSILAKQVGEGDRTDTGGGAGQKLAAGGEGGFSRHRETRWRSSSCWQRFVKIAISRSGPCPPVCREANSAHPSGLFGCDRRWYTSFQANAACRARGVDVASAGARSRTRLASRPAWLRMNSLFMSTSDCVADVLGFLRVAVDRHRRESRMSPAETPVSSAAPVDRGSAARSRRQARYDRRRPRRPARMARTRFRRAARSPTERRRGPLRPRADGVGNGCKAHCSNRRSHPPRLPRDDCRYTVDVMINLCMRLRDHPWRTSSSASQSSSSGWVGRVPSTPKSPGVSTKPAAEMIAARSD